MSPEKRSTSAKPRDKSSGRPGLNRSSSTVSQKSKSEMEKKKKATGTGLADWATVKSNSTMKTTEHGETDPFQCACKSCQKFWKNTFGDDNADLLADSPANRSRMTGPMFYVKHLEVKLGDRVLVWRTHKGVVKYIGPLADDLVSPHLFIGVQLDDNIGSQSNGLYGGKRYFNAPAGHGVMVKYQDILVAEPAEKVPKLTGHEMFPSYRRIKSERRRRREADPDYDIGITYREQKMRQPDLMPALPTSRKVASDRVVYDPLDTAYKDYIRFVNKPVSPPRVKKTLSEREKRNIELKKEFGGGHRADKMIETVELLRRAFDEGLEVEQEEQDYNR